MMGRMEEGTEELRYGVGWEVVKSTTMSVIVVTPA